MTLPKAICAMLMAGLWLAACGGSAEQGSPPPLVATDDPAATFAPVVYLPRDERVLPISARSFIGYSSLTWANDPCRVTVSTLAIGGPRLRLGRDRPAPTLDAGRLGGPRPYRARPLERDCRTSSERVYATNRRTDPFGSGRAAGLRPGEGFHLDLLTRKLAGEAEVVDRGGRPRLRGAPVYVDRRPERVEGGPGLRLTYWLLFGAHLPRPEEAGSSVGHEGDWQHVSVLLRRRGASRFSPVSVRYRIWGRDRDVPWMEADRRDRTRPAVHLARGSHVPYPAPGARRVRRPAGDGHVTLNDQAAACPACIEWRTWTDLKPLRSEPWYGYAGAWGTRFLDRYRSGRIGPPFAE